MTTRISRLTGQVCLLIASLLLGGCGGDGDGDGDNSAAFSVDIDRSRLDFTYSPGGPAPAERVVTASFDGDGLLVGYPPGQSEPAWLQIRQVDGSDTSSPVDIAFQILTAGLATGVYQATVRFATGDQDGNDVAFVDLLVTLTVANRLGVDRDRLDFTHTDGSPGLPGTRTLNLSGTGVDWSAAATPAWLTLDASSGVAPSAVEVGIDPAGLAPGEYQATLTLNEDASGDSVDVAIGFVVEPHRLFVADNGVAFASFPSAPSNLQHAVRVVDNAGAAVAWAAASDQAWLSVTAAGISGDSMTLTADPTGLATGTLHFAAVTVSSAAATIGNSETVRVGFYVAAADPVLTELTIDGRYLASDPIRPWVYVTDQDDDVEIYHVYTGALVDRLTVGVSLKAMTVSSDGETLYVGDAGDPGDGDDDSILPIALATLTAQPAWNADSFSEIFGMLEYIRVNGRGALLTHRREVFDTASGARVATVPHAYYQNIVLAAAADGHHFYLTQPAVSGIFDLLRYRADYSWITGLFGVAETHALNRPFGNVRDIAVNADGSKIYTASGGEYLFPTYLFEGDAIVAGTLLAANPFPLAAEIGPTGKFYGGINAIGGSDMWSYLADDSAENEYLVTGSLLDRQLRVSADGLRLLTLSDDSLSNPGVTLTATPIVP